MPANSVSVSVSRPFASNQPETAVGFISSLLVCLSVLLSFGAFIVHPPPAAIANRTSPPYQAAHFSLFIHLVIFNCPTTLYLFAQRRSSRVSQPTAAVSRSVCLLAVYQPTTLSARRQPACTRLGHCMCLPASVSLSLGIWHHRCDLRHTGSTLELSLLVFA